MQPDTNTLDDWLRSLNPALIRRLPYWIQGTEWEPGFLDVVRADAQTYARNGGFTGRRQFMKWLVRTAKSRSLDPMLNAVDADFTTICRNLTAWNDENAAYDLKGKVYAEVIQIWQDGELPFIHKGKLLAFLKQRAVWRRNSKKQKTEAVEPLPPDGLPDERFDPIVILIERERDAEQQELIQRLRQLLVHNEQLTDKEQLTVKERLLLRARLKFEDREITTGKRKITMGEIAQELGIIESNLCNQMRRLMEKLQLLLESAANKN